jgi:hypothetical protein
VSGVDLSVNVHGGDAPFFEQTYRHLVRSIRRPLRYRRIAVDRSPPAGRFDTRTDSAILDRQLARLSSDGLVDIIEEVDWARSEVERVMRIFYGDAEAPTRCAAGTAIYQYLWALDRADAPFVLHFDSDILVRFADGGAWIGEAIGLFDAHPQLVIATPEGGPPKAETVAHWIFGKRARRREARPRWTVAESVSTRYYLVDRSRLIERACPLLQPHRGARLEETLTHTFHLRGLERWSLNDDSTYALHPRRHNANHVRHLDGLIALVERDRVPFRRPGYRWDIRTEGRHFLPWRVAIARSHLRRHE